MDQLIEMVGTGIGLAQMVGSFTNVRGKMDNLHQKLERLTGRESDILTEVEYAESRLGQKRKREVGDWQINVQRLKGDISGLEPRVAEGGVRQRVSLVNQINQLTTKAEELIEQGGFSGGLTHAEEDTRAYELVTKELVGEAFGQNLNKVLSRLMEDDVLTIGIYGMGGVGKTTLVTHIHNRLLEEASTSRKVFWVTVSQERDVLKLQQMISECFNHALREKEDKIKRAAELSHLLKRESTVIILDDLWHTYDPQEVGIPLGVNACKLILTTRSLEICQQMQCNKLIKLESLPENEAWQLFVKNLGRGVVFTPEVETVAKSVAKECAGLPLGIVVVSGSMRGKEKIHEWRSALEELKEAKFEGEGMQDKVFGVLKFSFIRLNDPVVQRCFLHLALYPEDFKILTEDLPRNLVYLDFFSDLKSLEAQYDRGHTIVNKLVNVCLLERSGESEIEFLKMHDLVRDMAIKTMGSRCMVKSGLGLRTLPAQEEWVKDLEKVSLIGNLIKEIPATRQQSWALPRLLELHMSRNHLLRSIDGSFFSCIPTLQVLDLSMTRISMLPSSISNLVNLTHLLLRSCLSLQRMPSLAKLKALRTLDLYDSGIEEVPEGLRELVNLRCLDFGESGLKQLPPGILPELSNLQTLYLKGRLDSLTVQAREIMSLSKLEKLSCKFGDVQSYDSYVEHLQVGGPKEWELELVDEGTWYENLSIPGFPIFSRTARLHGCCIKGDGPKPPAMLPKDVQHLEIRGAVDRLKSLTDIPSITNSKLTRCTLGEIHGMEYVVSVSQSSSSSLPSLEFLELFKMMDLRVLAEEELPAATPAVPGVLHEGNKFWGLKGLKIKGCKKMRRLLTHVLLPLLANLEKLLIVGCDQMEEVIEMTEVDIECQGEGETSGSYTRSEANHVHLASPPSLNKMKTLRLWRLPALKSICRATISCPSLQRVSLINCPKLACTSLLVQLPRDGEPPSNCLQELKIQIGEGESAVMWNHPLSKSLLDP
ncbi:hypothetical protein ACJRO7_025187 [Eucalyptus globulus]|uniref:AAA+ ATPase domain-containing protein n=1 Tax=Eucalyptus globulus TaxID=34317 RepID=A0ABD3KET1_EUCGL